MAYLFDTHTHFDLPEYNDGRVSYNTQAYLQGVRHVVVIGYLAKYFERMVAVKREADALLDMPKHHVAFGLHPLYIKEHTWSDLAMLEAFICQYGAIAIGEIGLDTYPTALKQTEVYQTQQAFFVEQINLAKHHHLPVMLHIRKAHADVLKILKQQHYEPLHQGGIAHSFSGGVNEALAFAHMGFKLGVTGQITNPNAKKLKNSIKAVFDKYGVGAFVIETDCPDMQPLPCQVEGNHLNEPKHLVYVLDELACIFNMDKEKLAYRLWQNTNDALKQDFIYPA